MNEFHEFLEESYNRSLEWENMEEIHIVLGNEAGDLDSSISTLGYAHFLHSTTRRKNCNLVAFLPVLNFDREGLQIRLEHKYLFDQAKIDLNKLIYRTQLNFQEMVSVFQNAGKTITTYLVDHHILTKEDEVLKQTVARIFDHRPLDNYYSWSDHNLKMRIERVSCCCTLIADEMFKEKSYTVPICLAQLMFYTILYDMRGGSDRGTLDEEMKYKFLEIIGFQDQSKKIYEILDDLHCRIDHLTPFQILKKDLKCQNGILFPRLTILAEDFIKLPDAYTSIEKLCHEYKSEMAFLICTKKDSMMIIVDLGMFFLKNYSKIMNIFVKKLTDARFSYVKREYDNFIVMRYLGGRIGRKKVLPLILNMYSLINE